MSQHVETASSSPATADLQDEVSSHRPVLTFTLSGLLALPAVGLTSSPARAAESDISFSNIVVNNGNPIVVGTSAVKEVPVSYVLKHTVKIKWHRVFVYRGTLDGAPEETLVSSWMGPECTAGTSGGVPTCQLTLLVDPRRDLRNADVGLWKTGGPRTS